MGLVSIVLFPAVYYIGGFLIGRRLSADKWARNSIAYGIGILVWGAVYFLFLAWGPGIRTILFILVGTMTAILISLCGSKLGVNKARSEQSYHK